MKILKASDKDYAEKLFSDSVYHNEHLGWLSLWQLPDIGGNIRLFEEASGKYLIGLQPVSENIFWFHSFFSDSNPAQLHISEALRSFFISGPRSIYAISSHKWFSSLLEENGFRQFDEIIQLETSCIVSPKSSARQDLYRFSSGISGMILSECETSFPPLWRLGRFEWKTALLNSNYACYSGSHGVPTGYILADITEDNCHLLRIAVNQDNQQKGIASALVGSMINHCREIGITQYSVNTNKKNSAAVSFYNSLNYSQTGQVFPIYHRYV